MWQRIDLLPWSALVGGLVLASPGLARGEESSALLTMERAVELALERAPSLRAAEVEVELARGDLVGARVLTDHNPEVSGGVGLRLGPESRSLEASAALAQTFDLGRPRRHRLRGAMAGIAAAEEQLEGERLRVASRTRAAYVTALAASLRVDLAREAEALTRELRQIAEERLGAEAGTGLEVNLAALEWTEARRALIVAERHREEAQLELARLLAAPPDHAFQLPRRLPEAPELTIAADELVSGALERRRDLLALDRRRAQAEARLALARAEAWPELSLEASYDLEDGQDHIVGVGLSVELPLFQRNQGEAATARATLRLAELEQEAARLEVAREVRAALSQYRAARELAQLLGTETTAHAAENLELLRASFEEGSVGFLEVLLVQRRLNAAQIDAIDAIEAVHHARAELELALGAEVP